MNRGSSRRAAEEDEAALVRGVVGRRRFIERAGWVGLGAVVPWMLR
jgi:hypothetical protein